MLVSQVSFQLYCSLGPCSHLLGSKTEQAITVSCFRTGFLNYSRRWSRADALTLMKNLTEGLHFICGITAL